MAAGHREAGGQERREAGGRVPRPARIEWRTSDGGSLGIWDNVSFFFFMEWRGGLGHNWLTELKRR